jgi:NAD(P)-dependent dehydrogenase (short-subunit alcohol dehydrogenase family)
MDLQNKVVVVTGASSGIGRATAIEFSARGARVVVASRSESALEETARMCRAAGGGRVLCVAADVTSEQDVTELARRALALGSIDVWVNNAGVTLFGFLEDAPFEEHRRVIETNVYGPMLAARAVIPIFRNQRHGVLINVGSILSKVGQPFVPSYVISKFALNGLSMALRTELADERDIHVCTVLPYTVDTPHFESGANRVGREAHAMPPVQQPSEIAHAIVEVARHPQRQRHVPRVAVFGLALHAIFPRTAERLVLHVLRRWHFGPSEAKKQGNLFKPEPQKAEVRGVRAPLISAPAAVLWAARELFRIEADSAKHYYRRLRSARPLRRLGTAYETRRDALSPGAGS